jgi:hypothetical protein
MEKMVAELTDFHNRHVGVPGFVIGAGPSMSIIDKKIIANFPCIAVNSSILFDDNIKYWVSDDIAVSNWSYFHEELRKSDCVKFMYRSKLNAFSNIFGAEKTVLFDHDWWFEPSTGRKNMNGVIIKRDSSSSLIGARTSSGTALHIMAIMGCDPIIMLGMDGGVKDGRRYFWEGHKKARRLDGKPVRGPWDAFDYSGVVEYFSDIYAMNKGSIEIFDATPGNPMNVFPSIDWKSFVS